MLLHQDPGVLHQGILPECITHQVLVSVALAFWFLHRELFQVPAPEHELEHHMRPSKEPYFEVQYRQMSSFMESVV
jgi:hypothetical protein